MRRKKRTEIKFPWEIKNPQLCCKAPQAGSYRGDWQNYHITCGSLLFNELNLILTFCRLIRKCEKTRFILPLVELMCARNTQ